MNGEKVLEQTIKWQTKMDDKYSYVANIDGKELKIKVNSNFPEEDLYTLEIEGEAPINFNDWPAHWKR